MEPAFRARTDPAHRSSRRKRWNACAAIDCSMASLADNSTSLARSWLPPSSPAPCPRVKSACRCLPRFPDARIVASGVEDDRARRELSRVFILARHFSLPSFLSTKRSRMITLATAGTLTVATAISLAATLHGSSPVPAGADAAYTTTIGQQAAARSASDGVGQAVMFAQDAVHARASASSNSRRRRRPPPRRPRARPPSRPPRRRRPPSSLLSRRPPQGRRQRSGAAARAAGRGHHPVRVAGADRPADAEPVRLVEQPVLLPAARSGSTRAAGA